MAPTAVVKVGSSSITSDSGEPDDARAVQAVRRDGDRARPWPRGRAGVLPARSRPGCPRSGSLPVPPTSGLLQAIAAVGQPLLMARIGRTLGRHGLLAGQVLLTPHDFGVRTQYLHARDTLRRLLDLGVVPVVNENDTVADDEIRYGDNDRLAALVSHLVHGRRARAAHRHARAVHRRPAPRRGRVVDRRDRRGRRRVGSRGRRYRHGARERRHDEQTGGREDRGVVRRARRDRRRRCPQRDRRRDRGPRGGYRGSPQTPTSSESQAVDRIRTRRRGKDRRR